MCVCFVVQVRQPVHLYASVLLCLRARFDSSSLNAFTR